LIIFPLHEFFYIFFLLQLLWFLVVGIVMAAEFIVVVALALRFVVEGRAGAGAVAMLGEVVAREFVLEDGRLQTRLLNDVLVQAHEEEKHLVLLPPDLECHR